jgi:hypothetical protein
VQPPVPVPGGGAGRVQSCAEIGPRRETRARRHARTPRVPREGGARQRDGEAGSTTSPGSVRRRSWKTSTRVPG